MIDVTKREILESYGDLDWGVKAIKAPEVWNKTRGEGVKILLIDTGIDTNHPELKDAFKVGYNFFERNFEVDDIDGHGTHVAGLLVGKNTGVAPEAELHIVKVLNNVGLGTMASVMDGVTYAINYGFDIISMSLGVNRVLPVTFQERIMQAYNSGITIVSATGNNGGNKAMHPAQMDEVIAVGGLDKDLNVVSFSNMGWDTLAPSVEIASTYKDGQYARLTGTSMAQPLVAGGIALLISYYRKQGKSLSPSEIKNMLPEKFDLTELVK